MSRTPAAASRMMVAYAVQPAARAIRNSARRRRRRTCRLSGQIAELEQHLGARLLNRTTRKLSLTEGGQTFYERRAAGRRAAGGGSRRYLVDEVYDLAIRIGRLLLACAASAYLKTHGTPRKPADLADHAVLTYGYSPNPRVLRLTGRQGHHESWAFQGRCIRTAAISPSLRRSRDRASGSSRTSWSQFGEGAKRK
jgi:Bacterial regulatory helix-turn-helix protein, lysR family